MVVLRVLGFGGRPDLVVYLRAASFAARTAQALLTAFPRVSGALQLYVDDPIMGDEAEATQTLDLVLLWWLILGIPLAWGKGTVVYGNDASTWIGVECQLRGTAAVMSLPNSWVQQLLQLVAPFARGIGHVSTNDAQSLGWEGRAGRTNRARGAPGRLRPLRGVPRSGSTASRSAAGQVRRAAFPDRREVATSLFWRMTQARSSCLSARWTCAAARHRCRRTPAPQTHRHGAAGQSCGRTTPHKNEPH